ncbi:hypothetical protein [Oscillatoria salina]|uniref:hypothetical protein n=1 Tax=Oscillatoria salina TaxID=331517 RepID=UPI0013B8A95C|nr:hypothetical protein [Oscillatoria salina]MBZ8179273.1 hypothetical protein [Oscillatoria salina IIICB1]NET86758.1 hypothetical protein [Kamptonema sp. SIO1D9]
MPSSTISSLGQYSPDSEIWQSLKEAIANSSGFKRWQLQQNNSLVSSQPQNTDALVRRYLRETLETLAY